MLRRLSLAFLLFSAGCTVLPAAARAWTQHTLPVSCADSQTAASGGDRAPLALGAALAMARAAGGAAVWTSSDGGASWSSSALDDPGAEQARLLSPSLAITWARHRGVVVHGLDADGVWRARSALADWPLAGAWLMDALAVRGEVWALASLPDAGRVLEGRLYFLRWAGGAWQTPVALGAAGHARLVWLDTGMAAVVQASRDGAAGGGWVNWRLDLRTSADGASWSAPVTLASGLRAPEAQEAAVQLALASLAGGRLAVAFTGWEAQPHSQLWVKVCDASSGASISLDRMPDAGDMVFSPSLAALRDGRLAVVWQQRIGMDLEILLSEQDAAGRWSSAVAVSADPLHLDRDPHLRALPAGFAAPLVVAWTRADAPGAREWLRLAFGDAADAPLDGDGDGMPDAQEAGQDANGDGLDDARSDLVATWMTPAGRVSLAVEGAGALRRVQSLALPVSSGAGHRVIGDPVEFEVHGVGAGGRVIVHLRTPWPLPENAEWLKMNAAGQWTPTAARVWTDADGYGIRIELTDGGAGDEDGLADGVIRDPGVIGAPLAGAAPVAPATTPASASAAGGGGGGCLAPAAGNGWRWLLVTLLWLGALRLASRREARCVAERRRKR